MPSCDGKWTTALSGGLPPLETWAANPQFAIHPTVDGATYSVELVRHVLTGNDGTPVRSGLWVMKADGNGKRKTEFTGMVEKSKVSTNERRSLEVKLPLRKNNAPYVAIVATQEPGTLGSFSLTVTSLEDEGVTITPLQDGPPVKSRAREPSGTVDTSDAALPKPLSDFNPTGGGGNASAAAAGGGAASTWQPSGDHPDNKPTLEVIGQGLSKKVQTDAAEAVANAEAACAASGGLFEDPAFPASDESLGAAADALGVVSWRRLSEIEPPDAKPRGGDGSLLAHAEGCGLSVGSLQDEWLLGALNVVGGNIEVAERTFVDSAHADMGFYAVRLFAEDPNSDDDWQVVLIDDRIPCAADGQPAFGKGARAGGLWACLVEKAAAKRYGSYAALQGDGGGEATLRGLELVTGGKARELPMPGADAEDAALADAWIAIKEALGTDQVVCCRCDSGSPIEVEAAQMGIVPGRTYCVIVANDMMGGGQKLVRLRGFVGDSEWNGKWSDHSEQWTSRLRQLLAYSKDDTDGNFWMAYDDFSKYFTSCYAARVADDRWSKFSVKSRWMDESAGGGPAYASWRNNYQWLLTVPRETTMTFQLSLPDPRLSSRNLLALPPIGLVVVQGNGGENARRRKLKATAEDVVFQAGPSVVRRLQVTTTLPPSPAPYLLVPFTSTPGAESPYSLSILLDDVDDDGKPDITFEPCLPNPPNREDWCCKVAKGPWARASAAPSTPLFHKNDKMTFSLQSSSQEEGTLMICVETRGVSSDMRGEEGMQAAPSYPPIGFVLIPNVPEGLRVDVPNFAIPDNAQFIGPLPSEAVWHECKVPVGGSHVLIPYLGAGSTGHANLYYSLSVYSDLPMSEPEPPAPVPGAPLKTLDFNKLGGAWECEMCEVKDGGHGPVCPYRIVIEKMDRMEQLMDERIKFLDELAARG